MAGDESPIVVPSTVPQSAEARRASALSGSAGSHPAPTPRRRVTDLSFCDDSSSSSSEEDDDVSTVCPSDNQSCVTTGGRYDPHAETPRSTRVWIFVLLFATQLVANFDSGALASIYGMKPKVESVTCTQGALTFDCPSRLSDGTLFPPSKVSAEVEVFRGIQTRIENDTAHFPGGMNGTWACLQATSVLVACDYGPVPLSAPGTYNWSFSRVVGTYNTEIAPGNYSCKIVPGDDLKKSLLHDPAFNDLYLNKNLQGFLSSIVYLGLSVGAVLTGVGFRFLPTHRLVQASLVANIGFCLFFSLSFDRASLFASRFLVGVTQATMLVFAPVWVNEYALPEYSSLWIALIQAAVPLGIVMGYICAGAIGTATTLKWSWSFYVQCIALAPCVILNLFVPPHLMGAAPELEPSDADGDDASESHRNSADGRRRHSSRFLPATEPSEPAAPGDEKDANADTVPMGNNTSNANNTNNDNVTPSSAAASAALRVPRVQFHAAGRESPATEKTPSGTGEDDEDWEIKKVQEEGDDDDEDSEEKEEEEDEIPSEWENFKAVLANPVVWLGIWTVTSLYFVVTAMQLWITDYLTTEPLPVDIPGATVDDRYTTIVMSFGVTAITAPITGVVCSGFILDSDRFVGGTNEHPSKAAFFSTVAGFFATCAAYSSLISTTFWPFIVTTWFTLCFGGMVLPGFIGVVFAAVPPNLRDMTSSFAGLMFNLFGYFLGPYATGVVADSVSLTWGFRLALGWSAVACVFGVLTWIVGLRREFRQGTMQEADVTPCCVPAARCLGYKPERTPRLETEFEVLGMEEHDGTLRAVPLEGVELDPLIRLMLVLAEYAEDDALMEAAEQVCPIAGAGGAMPLGTRRSVRNLAQVRYLHSAQRERDVAEHIVGNRELLHELFSRVDSDHDGLATLEDFDVFLGGHTRLARKLRNGVASLKDCDTPAAVARGLFKMLTKRDTTTDSVVTWTMCCENGDELLDFVTTWRTLHLRNYYVLAGFEPGTDKHILLKRSLRNDLPYYWGPADPDDPSCTKKNAQIFLYSVRRGGQRRWTLGTPKDFVANQHGYFYANAVNKYGLLTSPARQSEWKFANRICVANKWESTLRLTTRELWEQEYDSVKKDDRVPFVGQPAASMGLAALGLSLAAPRHMTMRRQPTGRQPTGGRNAAGVSRTNAPDEDATDFRATFASAALPSMRRHTSRREKSSRALREPAPFDGAMSMSLYRHSTKPVMQHLDTYRSPLMLQPLGTFRAGQPSARLDMSTMNMSAMNMTMARMGSTMQPRRTSGQSSEHAYWCGGWLRCTPAVMLKKLRTALKSKEITSKHSDEELMILLGLTKAEWGDVGKKQTMREAHRPSPHSPASPAKLPVQSGSPRVRHVVQGDGTVKAVPFDLEIPELLESTNSETVATPLCDSGGKPSFPPFDVNDSDPRDLTAPAHLSPPMIEIEIPSSGDEA